MDVMITKEWEKDNQEAILKLDELCKASSEASRNVVEYFEQMVEDHDKATSLPDSPKAS